MHIHLFTDGPLQILMNALKGTTTAQLIVYVLTLLVATCVSVTVDTWMKGWDMCVQVHFIQFTYYSCT